MEVFARLLLLFCRLVGLLLTPFVKIFYKKHQRLPLIDDDKRCFTNESMTQIKLEEPNLLLVAASDLVMDIKNGKV